MWVKLGWLWVGSKVAKLAKSHLMGMSDLKRAESATNSDSVVERVISVCSLEDHCMGHPA